MEYPHLKKSDPQVYAAIMSETGRQRDKLELIASENFVSEAVMEAVGSTFTNKYAEGYPSKRYYGGCEHADEVENLAIERCKELFGVEYANVQPHAGTQANISVYFALLKPGDTILGMDLSHGGHLSHGMPKNISGAYFDAQFYQIEDDGFIDYDKVMERAKAVKPKMIVAGASAYPRVLDFSKFREIANEVGAYLFVDMAHIAGLVAAGEHPSPVPYADIITTTTHKTLRGARGGVIMTNDETIAKKINSSVFPGNQGGPLVHVIAGKAVTFGEALRPEFKAYQKQVVKNAKALAAGLVKRDLHLVSGGTDNHLMLLDLRGTGVTGKQLQNLLDEVNITVNKNGVPNDPEKPFITSGIRIGTPAVTTRGLLEEDMDVIADLIHKALTDYDNQADYIREQVAVLTNKYPLYPEG